MSDDLLFFDAAAKGENAVTPRDSGEPLRVTPRSSQDEVYTDLPHKETPNGIFFDVSHLKNATNYFTHLHTCTTERAQTVAFRDFLLCFRLLLLVSTLLRRTALCRVRSANACSSPFRHCPDQHCSQTPITKSFFPHVRDLTMTIRARNSYAPNHGMPAAASRRLCSAGAGSETDARLPPPSLTMGGMRI